MLPPRSVVTTRDNLWRRSWRLRWSVGPVVAALVCVASDAPADTTYYVTGGAGVGTTDNVNGAADNPPPTQPRKTPDSFVEGRLGTGIQHLGARTSFRADYLFDSRVSVVVGDTVFANGAAAEVTHNLAEDRTLVVGVDAVLASLKSFTTVGLASTPQTASVLPPPSKTLVLAVQAKEQFTAGLIDRWRLAELTSAGVLYTFGGVGTPPVAVEERVGPVLSLPRDQFTFDARALYLLSADSVTGRNNQVLALGPVAAWNHKLTTAIYTDLQAGGLVAFDLVRGGSPTPGVLGRAALGYLDDFADAQIFVSRSIEPSLFAAQFVTLDQIGAQGAAPFFERHLLVSGSGALRFGRDLNDDAARTRPSFRAILADAEVAYLPIENLSFAVRYQFLKQDYDDAGLNTLPSFTRHLALALVSGTIGTKPRKLPAEPGDPSAPPPIRGGQSGPRL